MLVILITMINYFSHLPDYDYDCKFCSSKECVPFDLEYLAIGAAVSINCGNCGAINNLRVSISGLSGLKILEKIHEEDLR